MEVGLLRDRGRGCGSARPVTSGFAVTGGTASGSASTKLAQSELRTRPAPEARFNCSVPPGVTEMLNGSSGQRERNPRRVHTRARERTGTLREQDTSFTLTDAEAPGPPAPPGGRRRELEHGRLCCDAGARARHPRRDPRPAWPQPSPGRDRGEPDPGGCEHACESDCRRSGEVQGLACLSPTLRCGRARPVSGFAVTAGFALGFASTKLAQSSFDAPAPEARFSCNAPSIRETVSGARSSASVIPEASTPSQLFVPCVSLTRLQASRPPNRSRPR